MTPASSLQGGGPARGRGPLAFLLAALLLLGGAVWFLRAPAVEGLPGSLALPPLVQAKVAFVDGRYTEVERLLQNLPQDDAKALRARALLELGRSEEASKLFGEILKNDPKNISAIRGMAATSQRCGRPDQAALYWSRLTDLDRSDARAWRELALCQRDSGDLASALASLQQSLSLDPRQSDAPALMSSLTTRIQAPVSPYGSGPPTVRLDPVVPGSSEVAPLAPQPRTPAAGVPYPGLPSRPR